MARAVRAGRADPDEARLEGGPEVVDEHQVVDGEGRPGDRRGRGGDAGGDQFGRTEAGRLRRGQQSRAPWVVGQVGGRYGQHRPVDGAVLALRLHPHGG